MESIDLLRSLTLGVNKKINSSLETEEDENIEYTVNAGLRKKTEKNINILNISNENEPEISNENEIEIIDDKLYEDTYSEEIMDDCLIESNKNKKNEPIIDTFLSTDIEDFTDEFPIKHEEEKNEHKLEQEKENKNKIVRNGNPFKRGPRNKKKENVLTSIKTENNSMSTVSSESEIMKIPKDEVLCDTVDLLNDNLFEEDTFELNKELFKEAILKDDIFENKVLDKGVENLSDEVLFEEPISEELILDGLISEEFISEESISEEQLSEETLSEEQLSEETLSEEQLSEETLSEEQLSEETLSEKSITEEVLSEEVEDKFKNCIYYKGMDIEEYLRKNPNYRESLYVEHFYAKNYLNQLLNKGLILFSKGLYRL